MSVQPLSVPAAARRPLRAAPPSPRQTVHMSRTTVGPVTAVLTLFPAELLPEGQDADRLTAELNAFVRHLLRRPQGRLLRSVGEAPGVVERPALAAVEASRPAPSRPELPDVHPHRGEVTVDGERVSLSSREHALLLHLDRNRGRVVSRHERLRAVWGWDATTATRTVDVHVARVRRKLGARAGLLRTVVGAGYVYG